MNTERLDDLSAAVKSVLDDFLPFVLLLLVLIGVFQFAFPITAQFEHYLSMMNWGFMAYFAVRLAVDYRLRDPNENFWRSHWMDILLVIPLFAILQEAKIIPAAQETVGFTGASEQLLATSLLRNSQAAAQLTRIARIVRKSLLA